MPIKYFSNVEAIDNYIHKEVKLGEGMNRNENILCKTDLNLIRRLT